MASPFEIATFVSGIAAGSLVALSSVPQILANRAGRSHADSQSLGRNILQGAGNGLWVAYGLSLSAWPLVAFATLSVALTGWLVVQQLTARSRHRGARVSPASCRPNDGWRNRSTIHQAIECTGPDQTTGGNDA